MNGTKLILGALAGLVAGVAIGMLLAPASGSETRQKIVDTAGNLTKRLRKNREGEFADSEMEMDATNGHSYAH